MSFKISKNTLNMCFRNNNLLQKIVLLAIVSLFLSSTSQAEEKFKMPFNFGIYAGGNFNLHNPNFKLSPDSLTSIPISNGKSSFGVNAGVILNAPLSDMFVFSGRIGFNGMGGKFEQEYKKIDTTYLATFDNSLSYLEITPSLMIFDLIPVERMYLLGGLEIGVPLTSTYSLSSTAKQPITAISPTYPSDTKIDEAKLRMAIAVGVGMSFNLSKTTFISPELSFRLPISGVSSNNQFNTWDVPQLRLGVNITFGLGSDDKKEDKVDPASTLELKSLKVKSYNKDGAKVNVDVLKVEDAKYNELFPLVPYVFFEQNEELPLKNSQNLSSSSEVGEFAINKLEADALQINKSTLDIIGSRMQKNSSSTIQLTGTNDANSEKSNSTLSLKRAEFVKNYLIVNYGITPDRIEVKTTNLPSKPSSIKDKDGIEENRRVELVSNDNSILAPIMLEKDRKTITDPTLVEFESEVKSSDPIKEWQLDIAQSDRTIKVFTGSGDLSSIQWPIQPNDVAQSEIPVEYTLRVKNEGGKEITKSGSIPVQYNSSNRKKTEETPDKTISRFSLMLFDFDSPNISAADKELIDKNIVPIIKYNSTIQIFGYTDRIGDEKYNQKLSLERATNVQNYLKLKAKSVKFEIYGMGENVKLFENDAPVGRQLSRTVQINIITPKE